MEYTVVDELNKLLGQVPPVIREQGGARAKLEALWRILAYGRTGAQTRVAGDLAERWAPRHESPRLPVDDPRRAAKRLDRCLAGETAFPLDFALDFIECLPEPYRGAARILVFPRPQNAGGELLAALTLDAQNDLLTDEARFLLAQGKAKDMSPDELEALAVRFDDDVASSRGVAAAIRQIEASMRGGA